MKVGDLVRYKWYGKGARPWELPETDHGIVVCTDGIMLCSMGIKDGEEPYKMGSVLIMWPENIERETYADLEVVSETR